jgi:hypothetical protein
LSVRFLERFREVDFQIQKSVFLELAGRAKPRQNKAERCAMESKKDGVLDFSMQFTALGCQKSRGAWMSPKARITSAVRDGMDRRNKVNCQTTEDVRRPDSIAWLYTYVYIYFWPHNPSANLSLEL